MNAQQYLSDHQVDFEVIAHRPTYTAQEMAQSIHASGDVVAKTVILNADGQYVLAVLQASHNIDFVKARAALGAAKVELADEREFARLFPDCEIGALPPFGSQYGLPTLVDESLAKDKEIVFEGNTHQQSIRMCYGDFENLEHPKLAGFTYHA